MTKEEAIKFAEHAVNMTDIPECKEFYRMCAAALRSPTREQVEKVWRGEWIKHDGYTECSECEYWYPSTEDEEEGDRNPFCPACGRPMTDKSVDMVIERLEALKDAGD